MNDETLETGMSFLEAMADVKPLPKADTVAAQKPQHTLAQKLKREALEKQSLFGQNYLSAEYVEPVAPHDILEYKKDGVQEGVFKNLRLGKYKIDKRLVLQKIKFEAARQAMFETILEANQKGLRVILVQHGLGLNSQPFPAFMKSYVNKWLKQMPQVLAFHSAQRQHGGAGATYVLIKKSDEQRLANKELHRRR
ncbi:MAG: DNA endonuclease SmrA [Aliiglaciecola sp.]